MPRPRNNRTVGFVPDVTYYKPRGVPLSSLQCVTLTIDEIEAIRLTDFHGLYQSDAADKMNISRQTLGRILESAHKKIADALTNGKALSIKGGAVKIASAPPCPGPPRRGKRGRRGRRHRGGRNL